MRKYFDQVNFLSITKYQSIDGSDSEYIQSPKLSLKTSKGNSSKTRSTMLSETSIDMTETVKIENEIKISQNNTQKCKKSDKIICNRYNRSFQNNESTDDGIQYKWNNAVEKGRESQN